MVGIKHFFKWLQIGLEGGEYILFAFLILGIITSIFLLVQNCRKNKLTRAKFIQGLLEKFLGDAEIQGFIQRIENNEEWFTKEFHQTDALKKQVYNALFFFNYICYLEETNVLPTKEYAIFEYNILKLATNRSFQNYMFWLYHNTEENQTVFPFYYLLDSCAEKMPGGFLDKNSGNYAHI